MTAACDLRPTTVVLWATAPGALTSFDTYAAVCASIDSSILLDGANLYCSLNGGDTWHPAGHRDAPAPTAGLAGELAEIVAGGDWRG